MAGWIEHDPKPGRIAIGCLMRGLGASAPDDELDGGLEIISGGVAATARVWRLAFAGRRQAAGTAGSCSLATYGFRRTARRPSSLH